MNHAVIGRAVAAVGFLLGLGAMAALAQPTSSSPLAPPPNGPRRAEPAGGLVVLTNATVHVKPGTTLEKATVTLRHGKIVSVESGGAGIGAGEGAAVRDLTGMHVYAGFIEPYFEVDVPRPDPDAPGSHWNPRVTPQRNALDRGGAGMDVKQAEELRAMGFAAAAISPRGGIFRGTSAVVSLAERSEEAAAERPRVYLDRAYQCAAFDLARGDDGSSRRGDDPTWTRYPGSQMGAIALIRQTLSDADWTLDVDDGISPKALARPKTALDFVGNRVNLTAMSPDTDLSIQALERVRQSTPLLFDVDDELEALRVLAIAQEFGRHADILGSGREYRRLEAMKQSAAKGMGVPARFVVPLREERTPKLRTIGEQESVSLTDLIEWEQAPLNAKRLDDAGVVVALTTSKIPKKAGGRGGFAKRLSNAVKHGLKDERALAMLTTNAAAILGVEDTLGTVEKGKAANLVIADGPLFADKPDAPAEGEEGYVRAARIVEVYIDGQRHQQRGRERRDLGGVWEVTLEPGPKAGANVRVSFEIDDAEWPPRWTVVKRTTDEQGKERKATTRARGLKFEEDVAGNAPGRFSFTFDHEPFGQPGVFTNVGSVEKGADGKLILHGDAVRSDGERMWWTAVRAGDLPKPEREFSWLGTWTVVGPNGAARVSDGNEPRLVIERERTGQPRGDQTGGGWTVRVKKGSTELPVEIVRFSRRDPQELVYSVKGLDAEKPDEAKTIVLRPAKGEATRLSGALSEDGPEAFQLGHAKETPEADAIAAIPGIEKLGLPVGPFAMQGNAEPRDAVISGATVWTCGPKGKIENAEIVVREGKIVFVGSKDELGDWFQKGVMIKQPWREVDAKGKHITPGIIDAHSHTGISKGVNEGGQAVTAEVRIGDVTNPDTISWYRQLAGGVTAVNSLHGSANPIGGQSQTNKNRWGCIAPNDMHFEGAAPGIKFALGENVKQSNWGDEHKTRYPQTRMGVETIMRDRFAAAKEYLEGTKARSHGGTKEGSRQVARGQENANGRDSDVQGSRRVAEGDDTHQDGLSRDTGDAGVRTIRADQSNASRGSVSAVEYRGGIRAAVDDGLSADAQDCSGVARGVGHSVGVGNGTGIREVRFVNDGVGGGNGSGSAGSDSIVGKVPAEVGTSPSPSWLRASVPSSLPPRRDLELEALAEILEGKRLIHCHSYRQDEILALCRVADEFGFTLGTFQHGLECYKVADEVKKHAIGASLFSDWWAYKAEVQDAIPYAGPILAEEGVVVSYNSDSDELARRMNVEAGKVVKYSGVAGGREVSPEEALKFVTLNPAKQLKIEGRVGSIEVGKDADLAVWSGPPLSALSRCERTFVDGREMFSLERDAEMRKRDAAERARIIQKILAQPKRGGSGGGSESEADEKEEDEKPTDEVGVENGLRSGRGMMFREMERRAAESRREHYLRLLQRGLDPRFYRSGDCGCDEWSVGN